jgi:hypothetical protein
LHLAYYVFLLLSDAKSPKGTASEKTMEIPDVYQLVKLTAKHLVLPVPVGPPSSYELKTW